MRLSRLRDDDGLSLLEALVAITIVAVVMTSVASFFVRSISATGQQRGKQVATHLADSAMEQVRALKGSAVDDGRETGDKDMPKLDAVEALLANATRKNAKLSTSTPVLPVDPDTVTVAGTDYRRYWYVGECALPADQSVAVDTDDCVPSDTGKVTVFRVVVAVRWQDKNCKQSSCLFVSSTLVSSAADEPVFNENEVAPAPVIQNHGDLQGNTSTGETRKVDGITVVTGFVVSGDAKPLTVSAENLPPGIVVTSAGVISGKPTKVGQYDVTVRVTDIRGLVGSAKFTWNIYTAPKLNAISAQTTRSGAAVNLQPVNGGGGEAPFTWAATGMPAGITIDAATGLFSGSPVSSSPTTQAAASTVPVTVTITDRVKQTSSVTFNWTVNDWFLPTINTKSTKQNVAVDTTVTATGGLLPLTWSAIGLPTGLTIAADTGRITGTPTVKSTNNNVTVTAKDARGQTRSATFKWNIT
jgi:type II secretory pathway pseudopilin PulG